MIMCTKKYGLRRCEKGFTLIELVVVIVLIGVAVPGLLSLYGQISVRSVQSAVVDQMIFMAEDKMEEITGTTYLIVGVAVAIASLFIDVGRLMLFFIAGVVMVIVGFIKLSKKKPQHHHPAVHHTVSPPPTNHRQQQMFLYCPRCGTGGHSGAHYCSRCGSRLVLHRR